MSQTSSSPPAAARAPLTVRCPACGEATLFTPSNAYRPFCSARCQGHDFGAWASENYRVPAAPPDREEPDA